MTWSRCCAPVLAARSSSRSATRSPRRHVGTVRQTAAADVRSRSRHQARNSRNGGSVSCLPFCVRWQSTQAARAPSSQEVQAVEDEGTRSQKVSKEVTSKDSNVREIRRLFGLAWPQRKRLGAGIGLMFVSASISMSVPLALGKSLDIFTKQADMSQLPVSLPTAATLLIGVFVVGASANMARIILMRIAGQRIIADARKAAFANVMRQDMAFFDLAGQKIGASAALASPKSIPASKDQDSVVTAQSGSRRDQSNSKEMTTSAQSSTSSDNNKSDSKGVKSTGDIISRLGSDAGIVGDAITRELNEGLFSVFTAIVGTGLMVWISVKLTAVVLLLVPPTAIGAVFYGRYIKKLSKKTQQAVGNMVSVAEEKLGAIRTVHAYNGIPAEVRTYRDKTEEIFQLTKKEAYASAAFFGGLGLTGNVTMIALLSYGGSLVSKGELTVGQLSSLLFYTVYVGRSLSSLTSFYSTIMRGLGASGRLFELIDARPQTVDMKVGRRLSAAEPTRPIKFKNVSFRYPTRPMAPVLDGLDLTIEPGTSIALGGGSGSGKSTVASLLLRYYDPSSGGLYYGDEQIKDLDVESWRDIIAFVDQEPTLWHLTVAENIAYGKPDATLPEIREAARMANCLNFIERLPNGFDTNVGRAGRLFSGGQKQRIAIARALVKRPKILVMDEATSALDSESEALVNDAISNVTKSYGLTTILIAHRLSTLKTAGKIVLLENGKVAEMGNFYQLSRPGSRFNAMMQAQLLTASAQSQDDKSANEQEVNNEQQDGSPALAS